MAFIQKILINKEKRLKKEEFLSIMKKEEIDEKDKFKTICSMLNLNSSYEIWNKLNIWWDYVIELILKEEFAILNRIIYNELLRKWKTKQF